MKELTKEDKARRYDEVINGMKHYVVDEYGYSTIKVADVFPELSESEDEKIRKEIIALIEWSKSYTGSGITTDEANEMLAYLENQGERKTTDKIQIGKEYKCIASPRYSMFMTGKIYKPEDKFLCSFMNFCSDCFEPIEDSDMVEPKFKVGDIIHCKLDNRTFVINEVDLKKGVYIYTEKGCGNDINYADEMFELVEPNPYSGTSFVYNNHTWGMCARDGGVDILCDSKLIKHVDEQKHDERKEFEFVLVPFGTDIKLENNTIIIPDGYVATIEGNKIHIKREGKSATEAIKEEKVDNANKVEPKFKVGDKIIEKDFDECDCGTITDIKDGSYIFDDGSSILIKEQDLWELVKQIPNDNVEPKFHEGDWITDGNITIQIEAIKNDCYLYCGDCALYSTKTADKVYHLWTLEDAKPGDIIYAESKFNTFDFIGIFYTLENGNFWCYCDVSSDSDIYNDYLECWEFDNDKGFVALDRYNFFPATKRQRHLLYQKMKDAGYEWDAEKKELKDL